MPISKLVICLLIMLVLFTGCSSEKLPDEEIPVSAQSLSRECAVYYGRGELLVPVMVTVEWGELNAALSEALRAAPESFDEVIPKGAKLAIYAEDDTALVDISALPEAMSSEEASRMLDSVSATLLQFEGIEKVKYTLNGAAQFAGIELAQPVTAVMLNPAYNIGDYTPFHVYYKTADGLMLPVTKEAAEVSPKVLINAMIKEPTLNSLDSLFPDGTLLNTAELSEGVLHLDFSPELYSVAATPGAEELLMTGINLACAQLEGVSDVIITVNGTPYGSAYSFSETAKTVFSNSL